MSSRGKPDWGSDSDLQSKAKLTRVGWRDELTNDDGSGHKALKDAMSSREIAAQKAREAAQEIVNEWVDSGQYATSKSARRAGEKDAIESIAALILRAIEESRQPIEQQLAEAKLAYGRLFTENCANLGKIDELLDRGQPEPPKRR